METAPEKEPYWTGPGYRGEYQCPHGVGHGNHTHGCDGCCDRDDFPLRGKVPPEAYPPDHPVEGDLGTVPL